MSYNYNFRCSLCGNEYKPEEIRYLCPECSVDNKKGNPLKGVLLVEYDYEEIRNILADAGKKPDINFLMKYLYPVEEKYFPDYYCGNTPFTKSKNLSRYLNLENIFIKNDSLNPSGSYKDRASFLVVAEANRINEKTIVTASTGNAASSLAAVCAANNSKAVIFVPETAPKAKLVQMYSYGAQVIKVKGTYDDAFAQSIEYTNIQGGLNRNTAYHPFTIEGKKTAGFEIFLQNGSIVPDTIFIPVGDGVIISGVYKAFYDLLKCGITDKMPKLICVQAENSNAIHNFIISGEYKNALNPKTVADSISVKTPSNAYLARRAVTETGGFSVTVSDEEIMLSQKKLASLSGIYAEPSSASVFAGLEKSIRNKLITKNEQIVLLITGTGLKDVDATIRFTEGFEKESYI